MAPTRQPIPTSWTDYEGGGRRGSSETLQSHVQWGEDVHDAPEHAAGSPDVNAQQGLRHRRCAQCHYGFVKHEETANQYALDLPCLCASIHSEAQVV